MKRRNILKAPIYLGGAVAQWGISHWSASYIAAQASGSECQMIPPGQGRRQPELRPRKERTAGDMSSPSYKEFFEKFYPQGYYALSATRAEPLPHWPSSAVYGARRHLQQRSPPPFIEDIQTPPSFLAE